MNLLRHVSAFLQAHNTRAYLVGGAVRDRLLERETHDLDITVQGNAAALAREFADTHDAAFYLMDAEFDVARVILPSSKGREVVDFARLRGEQIQDDLGTRDFTLNAMALDLDALYGGNPTVIDPFGGLKDIEARRVRAVNERVFRNDPVRLVRAARFGAELDFVVEARTEGWIQRDAHLIEGAAMERVRDEFIKLLAANHVLRNLKQLDSLELLGHILPELNALRGVTQPAPHIYDVFEHTLHATAAAETIQRDKYTSLAQGAFSGQLSEHMAAVVSSGRTKGELLRLALLLHDVGKPATRTIGEDGRIHFYGHEETGVEIAESVMRRLKFSSDEVAHVVTIVLHHMRPLQFVLNGVTDRGIHRYFRATGAAGVDVVVHAWCDQRGAVGKASLDPEIGELDGVAGRLLDRYYHARERVIAPPPLVNGSDVLRVLGIAPGPKVGEVLDAVREGQATGEIASREDALKFLAQFDPRT